MVITAQTAKGVQSCFVHVKLETAEKITTLLSHVETRGEKSIGRLNFVRGSVFGKWSFRNTKLFVGHWLSPTLHRNIVTGFWSAVSLFLFLIFFGYSFFQSLHTERVLKKKNSHGFTVLFLCTDNFATWEIVIRLWWVTFVFGSG